MPFVLTIRERGHSWSGRSAVTSFHDTRESADAELLDYVRRNWDAEIGIDPPDDPDTMIREYFGEVPEAYEIVEAAR